MPFDVTVGENFNDAYPDASFLPLEDIAPGLSQSAYRAPAAFEAMRTGVNDWVGQPCSAGHSYIAINEGGFVFPCGPYGNLGLGGLGSLLDPEFALNLRSEEYMACDSIGACICKEDYFHLKTARDHLRFEKSLGYYQAKSEVGAAPTPTKVRLPVLNPRG